MQSTSKAELKDTGERLIPETYKDSVVYGEHISRYLSITDVVKGKTVLDVACGTGYGSQMLSRYATKVIGVDYSEEAINYAKKNYPHNNLSYLQDDAEKLSSIKDSSMDVVVSMETIEHLHNPEKFVKQVKRILKPRGLFIVSTPNDEEYREGNDFHVHEFTLHELRGLIDKYFKTSEYYYQSNALAATFFNEKDMKSELSKMMLVEKSIQVDPQKAIYFVAIASNGSGKLPILNCSVALAQHWNTKGFIEWSQAQDAELNELRSSLKDSTDRLAQILESKRWRVISKIANIKNRIFRDS